MGPALHARPLPLPPPLVQPLIRSFHYSIHRDIIRWLCMGCAALLQILLHTYTHTLPFSADGSRRCISFKKFRGCPVSERAGNLVLPWLICLFTSNQCQDVGKAQRWKKEQGQKEVWRQKCKGKKMVPPKVWLESTGRPLWINSQKLNTQMNEPGWMTFIKLQFSSKSRPRAFAAL